MSEVCVKQKKRTGRKSSRRRPFTSVTAAGLWELYPRAGGGIKSTNRKNGYSRTNCRTLGQSSQMTVCLGNLRKVLRIGPLCDLVKKFGLPLGNCRTRLPHRRNLFVRCSIVLLARVRSRSGFAFGTLPVSGSEAVMLPRAGRFLFLELFRIARRWPRSKGVSPNP